MAAAHWQLDLVARGACRVASGRRDATDRDREGTWWTRFGAARADLPPPRARRCRRATRPDSLHVFELPLPPLRERRDDILPLSEAFLAELGAAFGRPPGGVSREARQQLLDYEWPGNVRELRNRLERAAILCDGGLITGEHLSLGDRRAPHAATTTAPAHATPSPPAATAAGGAAATGTNLRSLERAAIERALQTSRHNKSEAARQLGLTRTQLYVRLRKYGFD